MKTLKYILLGVILSSLVFSSFSFIPSGNSMAQSNDVRFCETYTQQEVFSKLDPEDKFFKLVQTEGTDPGSSRIGSCPESYVTQLRDYVQSAPFKGKVQEDLIIAVGADIKDQMHPLYAIKKSAANSVFPLQQDLVEVSARKDTQEDNYALFLRFSESGAKTWASMTRLNKGKDIAILFNGKVIAAPRVQEEITSGECVISGKFTEKEINELKFLLEN